MREVADGLAWFKSTYSNGAGNCVEIAATTGSAYVRDSKDPHGPALRFSADAWFSFVQAVKDDEIA
ncbi:DUF397 domain-containing protein [Streptomyces silvisoli]|uniref:DUF397 domain-containing protein n=1 Tax=Streptomyces silvisoli TaxID=3034235 RepID=A0ABT5ZTM6_9ACTN|nr:DUF397 domain-containing protein [Streptomyces silvisoli]MDF3293187.1 DUF397 domain-containing protein [Streptomyces silvisoli]